MKPRSLVSSSELLLAGPLSWVLLSSESISTGSRLRKEDWVADTRLFFAATPALCSDPPTRPPLARPLVVTELPDSMASCRTARTRSNCPTFSRPITRARTEGRTLVTFLATPLPYPDVSHTLSRRWTCHETNMDRGSVCFSSQHSRGRFHQCRSVFGSGPSGWCLHRNERGDHPDGYFEREHGERYKHRCRSAYFERLGRKHWRWLERRHLSHPATLGRIGCSGRSDRFRRVHGLRCFFIVRASVFVTTRETPQVV